MPTDNQALLLQVSADTSKAIKRLDDLQNKIKGVSKSVDRDLAGANDNLAKRFGRGIGTTLRNDLQGLAGQAGRAETALGGFGVAGLGAAAAMGALVIAARRATEAMSFGDELQTAADKLQISAEAMQELQFAADETDVPIEALREGLFKLNGQLGALKTGIGGKRVESAFAAIGLTKASLKDVTNANQLLPILADRLGQISDTAAQVQIARKLGIEQLLPLLREGSSGLKEMTNRAHELGLVINNETVQALADADRQMEIATKQINSSLNVAFAGLAVQIAKAASELANFLTQLRQSDSAWAVFGRSFTAIFGAAAAGGPVAVLGEMNKQMRAARLAGKVDFAGKMPSLDQMRAFAKAPPRASPFVPVISAGGGGRSRSSGKGSQIQAIEIFDPETFDILQRLEYWRDVEKSANDPIKPFSDSGLTTTGEAMGEVGKSLEIANNQLTEFGQLLQDSAVRGFNDVADAIAGAIVYGDNLGDTLLNIFRSVSQEIISGSIKNLIGGAFSGGGGAGGVGSFLTSLFRGHAAGTTNSPGGWHLTGERGPELVNMARGAQVIPNDILRGFSRGGSSHSYAPTLNLTVHAQPGMSAADARRTGSQLGTAAMREMARARKAGISG